MSKNLSYIDIIVEFRKLYNKIANKYKLLNIISINLSYIDILVEFER